MSRYDDIDTHYSHSSVRMVRRVDEPEGSFWPWGVLPWLGVLALSIVSCVAIQETTEAHVERGLVENNLNWVEASASGRTVTLTGSPPSLEAERGAKGFAGLVPENDWLHVPFQSIDVITDFGGSSDDASGNTGAPAEQPNTNGQGNSPNWNFTLADRVLTLNGEVPNEPTRLDIIKTVQNSIETDSNTVIEDKLVVLNQRPPRGYRDVAITGARAISKCDEGIVSFRQSVLDIECEISSRSEAALRSDISSIAFGRLGDVKLTSTEEINACETALSDLLGETQIRFASGSAEIDRASRTLIASVAESAKTCPGRLRIEGHTDNTGSAETNLELSQQRARAVRRALTRNGVEAERLVARGFGASQPAADNSTEAGRAQNRRIEIKVIGPIE